MVVEKKSLELVETDMAMPTLADTRRQASSLVCAIAYHPESARIGEELELDSSGGRLTNISRLEGPFRHRGAEQARPLATSQVSRDPLELRFDGALLCLSYRGRSSVSVEGQPMSGDQRIASEALDRGLTVQLGHGVVLLVHRRMVRASGPSSDLGMIGGSDGLERIRAQIRRVADLAVPVLIRGETGTGKELVARALHDLSGRRGAFTAVNMGAVPETTAAAELFGHVRGAFTDAKTEGRGYFQAADGGTLFLDEIGEASNDIQVKLLRALETQEIMRVGSATPLKLNVRVVAATDADLEQLIELARFKSPLYHRLSQFNITLPPLRERRADIPALFCKFLQDALAETRQTARLQSSNSWFPAELMARVLRTDWPGNIRQLRSFAHALVISNRGQDAFTLPAELEQQLGDTRPPDEPEQVDDGQRAAALEHRAATGALSEDDALAALRANQWEVRPAARALGIAPNTLYQIIDRSPKLRRASDLSVELISEALDRFGGDQALAADHLRLSLRALRQRMRELGLAG